MATGVLPGPHVVNESEVVMLEIVCGVCVGVYVYRRGDGVVILMLKMLDFFLAFMY